MGRRWILNNINSWGNVEYNVPLRTTDGETRTSTSVALRHIPPVQKYFDCPRCDPEPSPILCADGQNIIKNETYKTTSQEYKDFKMTRLPYVTYEAPKMVTKVNYMKAVENMLEREPKGAFRPYESICHSSYRGAGLYKTEIIIPEGTAHPKEKKYKTMDELRIPVGSKGIIRRIDPYLSSYLLHYGVSPDAPPPIPTSETLTINSEKNKNVKKGGLPKLQVGIPKKILKERSNQIIRKPMSMCPGALMTENRKNFKEPMLASRLAKSANTAGGVVWDPIPSPYKKLNIF